MARTLTLLASVLLFLVAPSVADAAPSKEVMLKDLDARSVKFEAKGKTEFDLRRKVHVFGQYATIVRPYPGMKDVFVEIYAWAEYISPNKKD